MPEVGAPRSATNGKKRGKPYKYQTKLNNTITECLSPSDSTTSVKFVFLKLGSLCNASESMSFTSAICDIEHIKTDQNKLFSLDFRTLFDQGFKTLSNYKFQPNSQELGEFEAAAIHSLELFFRDKGKA